MTIMNLPEDLVVEILSRVPAKSLARLRSTSKEWNTLIKYGTVLAKKHSANAPRPSSSMPLVLIDYRLCLLRRFSIHRTRTVYQFSLKDPLSNNSSEEVDIRNVFHCDGLLLCTTKDNRLVVWNPFSRETRWIQPKNSYKTYDFFALGHDNKSSCYKILRIDEFPDGDAIQTEYEIYDFTSNSWRVVGKTRGWSYFGDFTGVSLNGNTYWLAYADQALEECEYLLLSFDFSTESIANVSLPENDITPWALSVTGQGQQLCMLSTHFSDVNVTNVWVATKSESTGAMSWSKFLIEHGGFNPSYRFQFRAGVSFLVSQDKEVVLSCYKPNPYCKNFIHIVGRGKYKTLDHHGAKLTRKSPTSVVFCYVPSLVQIQNGI